jgi:hypothetical protein
LFLPHLRFDFGEEIRDVEGWGRGGEGVGDGCEAGVGVEEVEEVAEDVGGQVAVFLLLLVFKVIFQFLPLISKYALPPQLLLPHLSLPHPACAPRRALDRITPQFPARPAFLLSLALAFGGQDCRGVCGRWGRWEVGGRGPEVQLRGEVTGWKGVPMRPHLQYNQLIQISGRRKGTAKTTQKASNSPPLPCRLLPILMKSSRRFIMHTHSLQTQLNFPKIQLLPIYSI